MSRFLVQAAVGALILLGILSAGLVIWGFTLTAGGPSASPRLIAAAVVAAIGILVGVGVTIWRHTQRQ